MIERYVYRPDHVASPGDIIQEHLNTLDISGRELARRCGRSAKLIAEIIAGKAPIEPETAIQLERVLEISAATWLGMEANYRLQLARNKEKPTLAEHIGWARAFPVKELAKRALLKLEADPAAQVRELLTFFGCGSVDACTDRFKELSLAAARHSPSFDSDRAALLAWLRIGDLRAEHVETQDYDRAAFMMALKEIRGLSLQPIEEFLPAIRQRCADSGVVFVLERGLPGVALSGISRWLTPRRALIQQTARYLSNDHFWFTFFHECAHILLHSRKTIFLDGKGISNVSAEVEAEANDWASNFLIPSEELTRFITRFSFTENEVRDFAARHGIAPGIVVGQLQHRKVLHHKQMNGLREFYTWND